MRPLALPVILTALLLAGCGAVEVQTPAPPRAAIPPTPAFLETGIELAPEPDAWAPGDRVVLRVDLVKGAGRTVRYFIIELTDRLSPAMPMMRRVARTSDGRRSIHLACPVLATRLTVLDEAGRAIQQSDGETPTLFLSRGLGNAQDDYTRHLHAPAGSPPPTILESDAMELDYFSFMLVNESTDSNPVMKELVGEVIRRPSVLGLLFTRSITLKPDWRNTPRPTRWGPPGADQPSAAVGYTLTAGGTLVLAPVITTVRVRPPLGLCGGLIAFDAVKPDDPSVSLSVRLIAASRGSGARDPEWPTPILETFDR